MSVEIIYLLIAIDASKYGESMRTGFFLTVETCEAATYVEENEYVWEGWGPWRTIKPTGKKIKRRWPEWSCIPMIKPPEGLEIVQNDND